MDIKHVSGSQNIVAVGYEEEKMELYVQTNEGAYIYSSVHLGQYRAFQSAGFSDEHYHREITRFFARRKA